MGLNLKRRIPDALTKINYKIFKKIVYFDARKREKHDFKGKIDKEFKREIDSYYKRFVKKVKYEDFGYYLENIGGVRRM
jgi:hypothetical protein